MRAVVEDCVAWKSAARELGAGWLVVRELDAKEPAARELDAGGRVGQDPAAGATKFVTEASRPGPVRALSSATAARSHAVAAAALARARVPLWTLACAAAALRVA